MKRVAVLIAILTFYLCVFSTDGDALQYRINTISELNKSYLRAIQNIVGYNGLFKSGSDFFLEALYSNDPLLARFQKETQEAILKVQEARSKGVSNEEILKLQLAYEEARLRENKQFIALIESNLYNSIDYLASETLKNSLKTVNKIIDDVLKNWKQILQPLLEGDFGGVIKNAILQLIDSTYKVTFIDYCKTNYGATEKIAQYWWKTYFVEPFETSQEKKLLDEVLTKASDELKDKLKDRLTERLKLEIISKGNALAKEAIEETVKESAEKILKNIVETPALIVELFTKYYNVVDFQIMFNDIAVNEVVFIKQIRELVGNDENEINRCYFDRAYFLSKRQAAIDAKKKTRQGKGLAEEQRKSGEDVIPQEVITQIEEIALVEDPFHKVSEVQNVEDRIEELSNLPSTNALPGLDSAKRLIEYAFGQLENDEITLREFNYEVNRIVSVYINQLYTAKKMIADNLESDYRKRLISQSEYSEKLKQLDEEVEENTKRLNDFAYSKHQEIDAHRQSFNEKLSQLVKTVNQGSEMKLIQDSLSAKFNQFLELYKQKTGQTVWTFAFSSFSEMMEGFTEGIGKSFMKELNSKSPSLFLLQNGGWILESLLAICYEDERLTGNLIEKVDKLSKEVKALLDSVPRYYYSDEDGLVLYSQDVTLIENFKRSLLQRMEKTLGWKATISQWAYMIESNNEMTKRYLEVYLMFLTQKVEIFQRMFQIVVDSFNSLESDYLEKWGNRIEQMAFTIRDMWKQKITPDEARNELKRICQTTEAVDSMYEHWIEMRDMLKDMSSDVYKIRSTGVEMLNFEPSKEYSSYINSMIAKNDDLKTSASQIIEKYEKASLHDYSHNLKARILDYYGSDDASYLWKSISTQIGGTSFPLMPDDPDIMGVIGGDLEKALNLCQRFEEFIKNAEKRVRAADEADRVLNAYLDKVEAEVKSIEKAGGFTTLTKKESLAKLLAEAEEKAIEAFKSYGFECTSWRSSRWWDLKRRIENISVPEGKVGQAAEGDTSSFPSIEKPERIIFGDLVWLNVMKNGYPTYRFSLSPDGKKLLIERQTGFSLYNIEKKTLKEFPLPEPVKAILSGGYNFKWISKDKVYFYAYNGEGFEIDESGSYKERPVTTIQGMDLILHDFSPSGEYILAHRLTLNGKTIHVLRVSDAKIEQIGTTYEEKILQWVPGTDSVFFRDQNSKMNIYDVKSKTLKTYDVAFEDYVCALLPGGKWIVYGNSLEVIVQNLSTSQKITLWKGNENEQGANTLGGIYPLRGNTVLLLWMHHSEPFDYGVQVCKIE